MAWVVKPEVRALGFIALAACTISNPAFEGGEPESTGLLGTSAADDRDVGPEATTTPSETTAVTSTTAPSETTAATSTGGTDETGHTSETGSSSSSTDTEVEDPPPEIGPFEEPVPVAILNHPDHQDDDPTLPEDMLELFFASSRGVAGDIFVARREQVTDDWGMPQVVESLSSPWVENTPEISADGLTIYFSSNRELPDEDVFFSTRIDRESEWSLPERVVELSTPVLRDVCPFPTDEGLHVYSCMGRPFLPELELVRFDRAAVGAPWSPGTLLMELNTAGLECAAWLDPSERVIAFMSDRDVAPDIDLWVASRATDDAPFAEPTPIVELNSASIDEDPWMSPDGGTVYFASERLGTADIFMAQRTP